MVKLISFVALSTFLIAPTFASELWDLETRDVSEPHLFGRELDEAEAAVFAREMQGLFARQSDPEHEELARRHFNFGKFMKGAASLILREEGSEVQGDENNAPVPRPHRHRNYHHRHAPHTKHEFVGRDFDDDLLERNLDYELYGRDLIESEDLFERFYDDLD